MNGIRLLPTPRSVRWLHGTVPADARVRARRDAALPPEGYRLVVAADGILVHHADAAGRRYALATLRQIRRQCAGVLPCVRIDDAPALPVRGVLLDISRDRIPTMREFARLVDTMAEWKLNHLQLYCERAMAYTGHEADDGDQITLGQLARLGRACARKGIALSPSQNCFGHMERWFRHPRYEPLAELPGDPGPHHHSGPRSLCPAIPGAFALVRDLIAQQCAVLAEPVFNICGDETWDLGRGRSAALVAEHGYAAVYGDFLRRIMAEVRAHGRTPMFWCDIVLAHPAAAARLDLGAIALDWGYSGRQDFDRSQEALIAAGFRRRWICPGSACWSSFGGTSDERRANLVRAVRAAERHSAEGLLFTIWGDGGHRQAWPASLAGIAEAAHRSWCGSRVAYDPRAGGLHAFGAEAMGPWIDELGQLDRPLRDGCRWLTAYRAFHETGERLSDRPYLCDGAIDADVAAPGEWLAIAEACDRMLGRMPAIEDRLVADECRLALALIRLGCERGAEISGGGPRPADWRRRREVCVEEHRRLWLQRSRPRGLAPSVAAFLEPLG